MGLVGLLAFGGSLTEFSMDNNFSLQSSIFLFCVLCLWLVTLTLPSSRTKRLKLSLNLFFTGSERLGESARFQERVAQVLSLLIFWPPAPELLLKVNVNSLSGILIINAYTFFWRKFKM